MNGKKLFWLLYSALLLASPIAYRGPYEIKPSVHYAIQDRYLRALPSAFTPLSIEEKQSPWGKECHIGIELGRKLDFYRAITALRRAEILAPEASQNRKLEIQYNILLCYYLGKQYQEVINAYEQSDLSKASPDFAAFHDLLVILYDSYLQYSQYPKAAGVLEIVRHHYPVTHENLFLSSALQKAEFAILSQFKNRPYLKNFLASYEANKKSPLTAGILSSVLPGAGYLYVGQNHTALTAFLVNGLFIWSSAHFLINGPIAAGLITTSFEAGWYYGGIDGAARGAKFYNERLYETNATPMMHREKLFPIYQLKHFL